MCPLAQASIHLSRHGSSSLRYVSDDWDDWMTGAKWGYALCLVLQPHMIVGRTLEVPRIPGIRDYVMDMASS